jgi:gamma-glutamyltranspeptidase/glutathione hydrolase
MRKHVYFSIAIGAITILSCKEKEARVHGLITDSAMVVSAHPLASKVGVAILKKGGNAIDAAIATQFALAVVYPVAGNIGGGGFMLVRLKDGTLDALDYREKAPAKASTNMYIGETGEPLPDLSVLGHLASGVPGTVSGLDESHKKYGRLPWKDLVQPAIDLALKGFPLTKQEAENLNYIQADLKKYNTVEPDNLINQWKEGDTVKYTDLGHALERIRENGSAGFYDGQTAKDIVNEMERGKGLISYEDLKNYKAIWRKPVATTYRGYKIVSMPPPSSGGVAMFQMLKSVEDYPLKEWGWNSAKTSHLIIEAERRAYADRAGYLGDPDFVNIPVGKLTSAEYNRLRMQNFNPDKATPSSEIKEGDRAYLESPQTTHLSVVDKEGNAVAVTTTLNGGFGSAVVVAGSGFFLNNEMDDFSVKPGAPNMYGAVGGEANKILPGKRMLSSMTPTIVEKDGQLFMVVGTPGGTTIITSVFQTIINVIDHGMTMQEAVNAKKFHHQWAPDKIFTEPTAFSKEDSLRLVKLGHHLFTWESIGRVDAILVLPDKRLEGGADPRGEDKAEGY